MKNKPRIQIEIHDKKLYAALKKRAGEERRTLKSIVYKAFENYLKIPVDIQ